MAKFFTSTALSDNIHETREGFLLCLNVPITRTGELIYGRGETPLEVDDTGKVLVYRDADDVFHPKTLASFEGKPLTIGHPEDLVTPMNWAELAKGHMQNVRRGTGDDSNNLIADVLVQDMLAIQLIKAGLREVSCGYEAEYLEIGKGKGRQVKIMGNHLALVQKGRAGVTCAINDHDGKESTMSKFAAKMKELKDSFTKTIDEAMKDESFKEESKKDDAAAKKEEGKKDDAKDESGEGFDAVMGMMKDLMGKIDALSKAGASDSDESGKKDDAKKDDAKDEGEESGAEKSLEERLKSLELAVSKLLEGQSKASDEDGETEETGDEDESDVEDDDFEEASLTGDSDTMARAEILSPGIAKSKDVKANALKEFAKKAEGRLMLKTLNGGKAPTFDSAENVSTLFAAASEVMKNKRQGELAGTKKHSKIFDAENSGSAEMTADELNKQNRIRYGQTQN